MTEKKSRLQTDPLFLGLTRPPMLFGVTLDWFVVTFMIVSITFITSKSFPSLILTALTMHGIGLFVCSHEPKFKELIQAWSKTVPKCRNKFFHGNASSFDVF